MRLSRRRFIDNAVRLQLFALAYGLANFLRRLVLLRSTMHRSLTTLREKLIKAGTRIVHHAKLEQCRRTEGHRDFLESTRSKE